MMPEVETMLEGETMQVVELAGELAGPEKPCGIVHGFGLVFITFLLNHSRLL